MKHSRSLYRERSTHRSIRVGQPLLVRWRAPAHAQTAARVGDAVKIEIALSRLSRVIFDRNFFFFLFRFSLTFSRSRMRYPVKLRISKHTQGWRRGNERKIPLRFAISSRREESRVYVSKEIISPPPPFRRGGNECTRFANLAGIVCRDRGAKVGPGSLIYDNSGREHRVKRGGNLAPARK